MDDSIDGGIGSLFGDVDWKKGMNVDSREAEVTPKIGMEVFQIIREENDDGIIVPKIIRTVISTIYHDGTIRLMSQEYDTPIYYDKKIAIEVFKAEAKQITSEYTNRLKASEEITETFTDGVVEFLINKSISKGLTCNSGRVVFDKDPDSNPEIFIPTPKFEIGQTVYFVQEPTMTTMYGEPPKNEYEIATTKVEKVELYIRGGEKAEIHYSLDTAYRIYDYDKNLFVTHEEAEEKRHEILSKLVRHYETLRESANEPKPALTTDERMEESVEEMKRYQEKRRDSS